MTTESSTISSSTTTIATTTTTSSTTTKSNDEDDRVNKRKNALCNLMPFEILRCQPELNKIDCMYGQPISVNCSVRENLINECVRMQMSIFNLKYLINTHWFLRVTKWLFDLARVDFVIKLQSGCIYARQLWAVSVTIRHDGLKPTVPFQPMSCVLVLVHFTRTFLVIGLVDTNGV